MTTKMKMKTAKRMREDEVRVPGHYIVKVNGQLVIVAVTSVAIHGGWDGLNCHTGRAVHIKTAARLRREATRAEIAAWTLLGRGRGGTV